MVIGGCLVCVVSLEGVCVFEGMIFSREEGGIFVLRILKS